MIYLMTKDSKYDDGDPDHFNEEKNYNDGEYDYLGEKENHWEYEYEYEKYLWSY